jgi:diaminopimelate epimerase
LRRVRFEKYEGLGNDFLVIEADHVDLDRDAVASLCDRHFGVGADGVLFVTPPSSAAAVASMVVMNADGGRPEMCGNGLRCVAAFLAAKRGGGPLAIWLDTDAGSKGCEVDDGTVSIDMGRAEDLGPISVEHEGRTFELHRVGMGNPHAITFEELPDGVFEKHGLGLSTHPLFPQGTNVELCRVREDGVIDVRVWERGVGPTLACGTGACAVAALAALQKRAPFDKDIEVRLPGGSLFIRVGRDRSVRMRGPARRVFRGEVEL